MEFHILNGDALKEQLATEKILGKQIICRETLINGTVDATDLSTFWDKRAIFFNQHYGVSEMEYRKEVVKEFQKVEAIPPHSTINLWFEDDLFCQVNLWFIIWLLHEKGITTNLYLVKPNPNSWKGFGAMTPPQLLKAHWNRCALSSFETSILVNTWLAFQQNNHQALTELKGFKSPNFPQWSAVIQAQLDRYPQTGGLGRPEKTLSTIIQNTDKTDFSAIFQQFTDKEGIYGFGDIQVKKMLDKITAG